MQKQNFWTLYHSSRLYKSRMSQNRNKDLKKTPDTSGETTKHDAKHYNFKFENLVLAGGGAKGVAYCGVARALEEHGILQNIRRFAGTSAGAIVAALLCIGFNSHDIEEIMRVDMKGLLIDSWSFYIMPNMFNMIKHYGFNHAEEFSKFIRDVIAIKTRKSDITFKEVYEMFTKELCVMVTNANKMSAEYCHQKTTPDMPIWKAIRMSISIPVEVAPFLFRKDCDEALYIDGGVLCNYPIHCFDEGSILLMDGSLDENLPPESYKNPSKCQTTNLATLGCLVYAEEEYHTFRDQIEKKCNVPIWIAPDTKLARKRPEDRIQKQLTDLHLNLPKEDILKIFFCEKKTEFSLEDFKEILKKAWDKGKATVAENDPCCRAGTYFKLLYGEDAKMIYDLIKKEDELKVTTFELMQFADQMCSELFIKYRSEMLKWEKTERVDIFYKRLFTGLMTATMTNFFKADDVARTVGINTGYINMTDFEMEDGDKQFLINQGKRSTEEFLKQFVHDNQLQLDTGKKIIVPKISLSEADKATIRKYIKN